MPLLSLMLSMAVVVDRFTWMMWLVLEPRPISYSADMTQSHQTVATVRMLEFNVRSTVSWLVAVFIYNNIMHYYHYIIFIVITS